MKTVILIRHAKSDWGDDNLSDHERPLNKRGKNDAPIMAEKLKSRGVKIDKVFSSTAKRAKKTAKIFSEVLAFNDITFKEEIYHNGIGFFRNTLPTLDNDLDTIAFFGHNPDLTSFAIFISGNIVNNIPTTGIFCVDFEIEDWKDIFEKNGNLRFFDYPKSEFD